MMPDGDLNRTKDAPCYWCGKSDHDPKDCPSSNEEKLRHCYQAVTGPLIGGDYIGPMRGEVNVCLNVIHFHLAFEKAAKKLLTREQLRAVLEEAYSIRAKEYGRLLW
jgi:hypothetical protein